MYIHSIIVFNDKLKNCYATSGKELTENAITFATSGIFMLCYYCCEEIVR